MNIPKNELLESLKLGYIEYKDSVNSGSTAEDLAHVKGYCVTLEQILSAYGGVTTEEMMKIKQPIIGKVSLRRGKKKNHNVDYDVPTIFRKQFD